MCLEDNQTNNNLERFPLQSVNPCKFYSLNFRHDEHINITGSECEMWIECLETIVCDRVDQIKGTKIKIKPRMLINFPCKFCTVPHLFHLVFQQQTSHFKLLDY